MKTMLSLGGIARAKQDFAYSYTCFCSVVCLSVTFVPSA